MNHDRLLLLISAIANNPGIAPSGVGVSPVSALRDAMRAIAHQYSIPWQEWSDGTIKKDLETLRKYGILTPYQNYRDGYYFGIAPNAVERPKRSPRAVKAKLTPKEMSELKDQGLSYGAIAEMAGITRQGAQDAVKRYRNSKA